jgi:uncharacterized repeat protein (TIGR01451 family)
VATASGSGNISDLVTLLPGGTATFTVTTLLHPGASATGATSNTATVTQPNGDTTPADNTSTDTLTLTPQADLALGKTASSSTVVMGADVTYSYVVHNNGPDTALNVVMTDPFPAGLTFVSAATPSQGTYNPATNTWTVGNLANGASATLQVAVLVNVPGTITNTATISANTFDPNLPNNVSSATITSFLPPPLVSKRFLLASSAADPPADPPSVAIQPSDQAWLSKVYQDLLNRPIDAGGLAGWVGALGQGMSRSQIVQGIEASTEYRADQVEALYGQYLHRAADPAGLAGYVSFLQGGGTVEQVAAMVAGSPEFFHESGGTNSGFLAALYQDGLGRPIDPVGAASWGALLSQGVSRNQVALDILSSPEYDQHLLGGFYTRFLNRAADPGSMVWVNALLQGMRDETIIAGIMASPEFLSLA